MIVNKPIHTPTAVSTKTVIGNPVVKNTVPSQPEVSISELAALASQTGKLQPKYVIFDTFGTEAHRQPPQPASALEEMIYARGGQRIDFTQTPPRWPDNNKAIDFSTWLDYEKELDKQTGVRIEIYEKSILSGLTKDEIISEIATYNATLGPRYYHSAEVENRPNDIEREPYKLPPQGTYHPDVVSKRDVAYQNMISAMATVRKTLSAYSG